MVYCFVHLDDAPDPTRADAEEEAYVIVPDTSKVAMAVPLEALPEFLIVLERAIGDLPRPQCPACTAAMPSVAVTAWPQRGPPLTG